MEVGELREGRLVAGARLRVLPLAPLHQSQLVVGDRVLRVQLQRLHQAGLGAIEIVRALVGDAEIDVRRRQGGLALEHLQDQGDAGLVALLLQHAHGRQVVGPHPVRDAHALRDGEPAVLLLDLHACGAALGRLARRRGVRGHGQDERQAGKAAPHPRDRSRLVARRHLSLHGC
jgi:hypothetical protein